MPNKPTRIRRALLAAALAAGVAGAAAGSVEATANVTTNRLAGDDRYGTAAAVASNAYPSGTDTVIIASGRSFPDALAGSALAARQSAPVLLTEPSSLPAATANAIDSLKATKAIILGGTTAVSQEVEDELKEEVTVSRISGADRYDTAAKIAAAIGAANVGSTGGGKAALIATGVNFADALAGGALSAAGSSGVFPVLLVDSGIPAATRSALTDLGIKQAVILGGTNAVSQAVADELQQITGNAPQRFAGADRYETATAIATAEFGTFGFSKAAVYLASGENFADALAGGALGGKNKTAILLTPGESLASATGSFLRSNKDTVATITALGGTAAVSDATLAAAKSAAQGETSTPAPMSVSPTADARQATGSSRTYTATGLTGQVDIVLVNCEGATDAGQFDNANENTIADGTASGGNAPDKAATDASIQSVNNTPNNLSSNNDYADDATPSNGTVTFVVAGPSSTVACVEPVVFTDANGDDALNSNAASPARPSEAFATGGETTFAPAEAAAGGTFTDRTVAFVDTEDNVFVACQPLNQGCLTFGYDSGDTFKIDPPGGATAFESSSLSGFEDAVSAGDGISINTYKSDGRSEFLLTDGAPRAPDPVSASRGSSGVVTVTFPDSQTASVDAYQVHRGTAANPSGCSSATYAKIGSEILDGNATNYQYLDSAAAPVSGTVYCYKVQSIDGDDEGPLSSSFGAAA